jgi:hypothetical protein
MDITVEDVQQLTFELYMAHKEIERQRRVIESLSPKQEQKKTDYGLQE